VGLSLLAFFRLGLVTFRSWWVVHVKVAALIVHGDPPWSNVTSFFLGRVATGEHPALIREVLQELGGGDFSI
jgi:hypothetical protein